MIDPSIAIGLKPPPILDYLLRTKGNLPLVRSWPKASVPYGSAYWGAPAAHTRAREVVGAAESRPQPVILFLNPRAVA